MYVPPHFNAPSSEVMHTVIAQNPFGTLFTHGASSLDANYLPFELHASSGQFGVLHGHVARNNPVWQDIHTGDMVLAVFNGGNAYISPQWYPSKQDFHKQVPTWNYIVVHAHGRVTIQDDERYVRGVVARLTRMHERAEPTPWKMTDSPANHIDMLLKAIVGIEIEITKLVGKFKLSQNKEERDIRGAASTLKARGHHTMANAMHACADAKRK
jgi:transcriptional regulator